MSAVVAAAVVHSVINPAVYAESGLDQKRAAREARNNPNYQQTRRWMAEKTIAFLREQGMITWYTEPIYRLVHIV